MSSSRTALAKPNYAIFRVEKIKTKGELANRAKHNDRTRVSENVDITGPPPRSLLGDDTRTVVARAEAVFEDKGINFSQKEGKVLAVEILMTASRDFFERATPEETERWVETSKKFAQDKFGDGLIDLMLHLDEETPHIHGFALPLVEKPKLQRGRPPTDPQKLAEWASNRAHAPMIWALDCDRYFGGDRRVLSKWQDEYHAAVAKFGLARGEKKRDEDEIDIGDGILIDAAEFRHPDGPRRNIKPKEGREILKIMLAAAEREKEDIQQQLEMTREHLQEAADAKRNAEKLKADQETLLASVQEDRRRQEADFIAAQRALTEERQEARRLLAEAKVEADKLTQNAHKDAHLLRAQIAEERRLNDVRLGLLERAVEVEDKHGLNLRPAGDSFSMFRVYHHMMVNLDNIAQAETTITERQAYLAGLVVKATKALSPDQQVVLNEVKKVVPTDALRAAWENARAQQQHDR